jgi:hypothetical protein
MIKVLAKSEAAREVPIKKQIPSLYRDAKLSLWAKWNLMTVILPKQKMLTKAIVNTSFKLYAVSGPELKSCTI